MKGSRNILILAAILLALATVYYLVVYDKGDTTYDEAETAFSIEDTNAVQKIVIKRMSKEQVKEELILTRDGKSWKVNDKYYAFGPKVSNLLRVMNKVVVREPLEDKAIETVLVRMKKYHLDVEVSDEDGVIRSYKIGPTNSAQTGNYMLLKGSARPYVMTRPGVQQGYISVFFNPVEDDWREKELWDVRPNDLSSIEVVYGANPVANYKLVRDGEVFAMEGGGELDEDKLAAYLGNFKGKLNAESFGDKYYPNTMDTLRNKEPSAQVTITKRDGSSRTIVIFDRTDNVNNYFGWRTDRKELLTIQRPLIDPFLDGRENLLKKPL